MYFLDENLVQIWREKRKDLILLLNHKWRDKEEIMKRGFKLFYMKVTEEQLTLLYSLRDCRNEAEYNEKVQQIGNGLFQKLIKYDFVTETDTTEANKKVWHSQVGEYLSSFLKAMYGIDYPERPSRVLLLPTLRCSGNCIFCITNSKTEMQMKELGTEEWEAITERVCKELHPCSVDIVGGEPMMKKDVSYAIAKVLVKHNILVKLITNGVVLANEDNVKELSSIFRNAKHNIQISLDGDEETHNYIRPGVRYDKVMKAIENISSNGLTFGINLTINKLNLGKAEEVVKRIATYKPAYILFGPLQVSPKDVELCSKIMITQSEEEELRQLVERLKEQYPDIIMKYDKEEPVYHNDTVALGNSKKEHRCTGYIEEMSILPNGRTVSCLRGTAYEEFYGENVMDYKDSLAELWNNSEQAYKFRHIPVRGKCMKCKYNQQCNLGCPLETYILDGVLGGYDPHCQFEVE